MVVSNRDKVKKVISIVILLVIFGSIWAAARAIPEERINDMVREVGVAGPVVVVLFALVTNVFAPVSGGPVMYAGYHAYGPDVVWLIALAGYISFVINFTIARKLGTPIVERLAGKENLDKINKFLMGRNEIFLFCSRMFHGGLHDFISYAAGLTDMPFKKYLAISTGAIIPGTLIWYFLVSRVDTAESFMVVTMIMSGILATIFTMGMLKSAGNENK